MSMKKPNPKMTNHVCVAVKAPPPNWRLTFSAQGSDADVVINEGSLVSIDANGKFVLGCGVGDGKNLPMPMWAVKGLSNFGVIAYGGNAFAGNYDALVATGGFEIQTSEFDKTALYAPNDAIVPATGANAGLVTKATTDVYGAAPVVGIVSKGTVKEGVTGTATLRFWSVFIPASAAAQESSSSSNL